MILLSSDVTDVQVVDRTAENKGATVKSKTSRRARSGGKLEPPGQTPNKASAKRGTISKAQHSQKQDCIVKNTPMDAREKVHIVEHKRFSNDTRRHFVGEVEAFDTTHIRVHGYPFVYDADRGKFVRIEPMRTCVFSTDNNIGITILPPEFDIENANYSRQGGDFIFEDGGQHSLEIGAYSNVA